MADRPHTTTASAPDVAPIKPSRRGLLGGIAALLAAAAARPTRAAPPADPNADRLCTVEDYAALTFGAVGESLQPSLGTRAEWIKGSADEYPTLIFMLATLEKSSVELDQIGEQVGAECLCDMVEAFNQLEERYSEVAKVLGAASTRTMTTLARMSVAEDATRFAGAVA
jgi:hypothetical protein